MDLLEDNSGKKFLK